MTSWIQYLAYSLGKNDEGPNITLAKRIASENLDDAVKEMVGLLRHKTSGVRSDAIKVLYETGERNPGLIAPHGKVFLELLKHKDNRLRWGAMAALATISEVKAQWIAGYLPEILNAMDEGTVITRDKGISILVQVARLKKYHADMMELLLHQIEMAPVNQVNQYAEKTAEVITPSYVPKLIKVLESRQDVMEIPSKRKRSEKLIKTLRSRS